MGQTTPQSINVIIPNWNSGPLLHRCLRSIEENPWAALKRVIVVDNASTDGSASIADFAMRLPIQHIVNEGNRGFGTACNEGAASCPDGDFLFLNPDIVLRKGTMDGSLACMASAASPGIVGILLEDEVGNVQSGTSRFPSPLRILAQSLGLHLVVDSFARFDKNPDPAARSEVDQVMGAFLLIRRDLFTRLGGFDERFFLYYEDVDLCLRARQAGEKCVVAADAVATHTGQGSTRAIKDLRLFYLLRSRLLYSQKHFGRAGHMIVAFATLVVEPVTRVGFHIFRGAWRDVASVCRGYMMLYRALPRMRDSVGVIDPPQDGCGIYK